MLSPEEIELAKEFRLSKDFTLYEAIKSEQHPELVYFPCDEVIQKLSEFYETIVQPIRDKFGKIRINSGYRNSSLNHRVGGVPNSVHQIFVNNKFQGVASDIVPLEAGLITVYEWAGENLPELKAAILYRSKKVTKTKFIHLDTGTNRAQLTKLEKISGSEYVNYTG